MGIRDHYGTAHEDVSPFENTPAIQSGAIAGFVATLVTLVAIVPIDPEMLSDSIAGMYGLESALAVGAVAHLVHGTIFGLVFALVLSDPGLVRITDWLWKSALIGVVYGLVLALMATGFIMPAWLEFVGVAQAPEIPFVTGSLVGWHVLYGLVLGIMFPFVEGQLRRETDT